VPKPFHYAFPVIDLASTRRFYGELLGCTEGRSTESWVDFDFFGNQISAHVAAEMPRVLNHGHVDGIEVPIPHFGAILEWDEFEVLAKRLESANISFVITPRFRFVGQPSEHATMFFCDFSGNPLEFKAFRHPENVFAN
jgi:extradiol dioxygenase family protein